MSDDVFDGQMLSDKLFKLNSSQQSIESLSRLCISQRKKAKQIVEIWHKSFKSAQREQHVSFLYLANDILQNSRRKGSEFVSEFWKVMPSALKHVNENGDESGKKAASRLVGIWHERKVFGSRGQNLKDEMLGKSSRPQSTTNGRSSNPIKIVKRDANSVRLKLAVGGTPEKILTAFHLVHDENATEDSALNNCEGAIRHFGDLQREIESQGVVLGPSLVDDIKEQENVLDECVKQLEAAEKTRTSLISELKTALQDQELKLEAIQSQLQVARHQIDQATNLRKKLTSPSLQNQSISFGTTTHITEEENKKAAAAAMAAKLAASTSSAQMLTSVLSSLVAEEAAREKRPKLENVPNPSNSSGYFTSLTPQTTANQPPFPPPPPPVAGGTTSSVNQFVPSSGLVMAGVPLPMPHYVYSATTLPPPPLPPPHLAMGFMSPARQHPQSQPQQESTSSGYYRPPGIGFYGPTPPPVPRQ